MKLKNGSDSYGVVSRFFHWSIALFIIGLAILGFYMTGLEENDPARRGIYGFHKSMGVLVLELALLRVLWLSYSRPPQLPSVLGASEQTMAKLVHLGLYAIMFLIPLSGYVMSTAKGYPVMFFGLYEVPALLGKSEALAEFAEEAHELLTFVGIGLLAAHVLGALKHRYFDMSPETDVLKRMI